MEHCFKFLTFEIFPSSLFLILVSNKIMESVFRKVTGQVARKSSRPKSYRPEPESCRPKYIVMSPAILSSV